MFTEYGNEGNDCCPELTQSDSLPFKVLRWILMSLQLMKDPDLAAEVTYLAEDSDLSEWHLGMPNPESFWRLSHHPFLQVPWPYVLLTAC